MGDSETELDVIVRVLEAEHVRDSLFIANRIRTALIRKRYNELARTLDHRRAEGLLHGE